MNAADLLGEMERLPHDARMKRMVEVGRQAAADPSVAEVLDRLEQGSFYERLLALQSCFGSGNSGRAQRAVAERSRALRGLAVYLVALLGDDAQVLAALEAVSLGLRGMMLRLLRRRRRLAPVDAFLEQMAARGDQDLARLLPFGSPAVVERHLQAALAASGPGEWRRFARLHPDQMAGAFADQASGVEEPDPRLLWQANSVLPMLSRRQPDAAVALARSLLSSSSPGNLELQPLALRRPAEVADIVLAEVGPSRVSFGRVAYRLDDQRLLALVLRHPRAVADRLPWFRHLPPERRSRLFAAVGTGWRDAQGSVDHQVIAHLPAALREEEARRHVALPSMAAHPESRLPYAALLPWDEARAAIDPYLGDPDPELRVAAHRALSLAVRYHRDRLGEVLKLIQARGNEQDPVRLAMLSGLADLPPSRFRAEHVGSLDAILRRALGAADLSAATAAALERLVLGLLPFHPDWSAGRLAELARARGQLDLSGWGWGAGWASTPGLGRGWRSFPRLESRLSDADVRRIAPLLLPVLRSWANRDRESALASAAGSLGRRLRAFEGLVELLQGLLEDTRQSWVADRILSEIGCHCPERLAELVPRLLSDDPSWITRPAMYGYLHRRRQDLLTGFLGRKVYRGRFATGKTRFLLPVTSGFHRWTARQQELFASTLDEVARDAKRHAGSVFSAIHQMAALPAASPARLVDLARLDNPRLEVRDTALRALGQLDSDEGIPALLEALGDDRARIAIYALRRAVLQMPESRALPLLRAVPVDRVTVAKEAVRLLGELRSEEAYQELLALDRREPPRDVRVALVRALWNRLDRDEAWRLLGQAAGHEDRAVAAAVVDLPADRLSPEGQRRLGRLVAQLLAHPDPKVRVDALHRAADRLPIRDSDGVLVPAVLPMLDSRVPEERLGAARALFALYTDTQMPLVLDALRRLIPNRPALVVVLHALESVAEVRGRRILPLVRAVLDILGTDPLTASRRVGLALRELPWEEAAAFLVRMARAGELHPEALMVGVEALRSASGRPDVAELSAVERLLAASPDPGLRRLGLAALVATAERPRGWDEEKLARLRAYRHDPDPMVAAAAQFTRLPEE